MIQVNDLTLSTNLRDLSCAQCVIGENIEGRRIVLQASLHRIDAVREFVQQGLNTLARKERRHGKDVKEFPPLGLPLEANGEVYQDSMNNIWEYLHAIPHAESSDHIIA